MVTIASLWLPILISAVIVFISSTVIHMGPFWHRGDFPSMPRESEVLNALRPFAIPPGDYFIPRAGNMEEMRTREFKDKLNQGPVAVITVMPNGMMSMRRNLLQWFVFLIVVSIFCAYIAGRTLPAGRRTCACSRSSARRPSSATRSRSVSSPSGTGARGA